MRVAEPIETDVQTERELRALSRGRRVEARVQQRASLILLAAQGWQNKDIAEAVKLDRRQVALWRRRFIEGGIQALLQDASRPGRPSSVTPAMEWHILRATLSTPPGEATAWSTRTLGAHLGLSATTVRRVWQRHGIKPHAEGTPGAPRERLRLLEPWIDVVGLCTEPRTHALVLASGPGPGPGPGRVPRALARSRPSRRRAPAPDGVRQGTPALLAALASLDAAQTPRPGTRREPWAGFLRRLQRLQHAVCAPLQLHWVVDRRTARRYPALQAWLARHARGVLHVLPTAAPWRIGVERLLCELLAHPQRRGGFANVPALLHAIGQHAGLAPADGRPFAWTARARATAMLRCAKAVVAPRAS